MLFLFGFFLSVPTFLATQIGIRPDWKYRNNRLVTFQEFTAKIRSTSIAMGILSVLFMLSMTFLGAGTAICMVADKNVELSVFDIIILHKGEGTDFSEYEEMLSQDFPIQASHSYSLYTGNSKAFLTIRNNTISDTGRHSDSKYAEYQYDTYMKQSDYAKLREILGLDAVELNPSSCYVHCVPAIEKNFKDLIEKDGNLNCAGYPFAKGGLFTEPFSQMDTYGNGLNYVIVVPDQAVSQRKPLYSLYAAVTKAPLTSQELQKLIKASDSLKPLKRNIGKTAPDGKSVTSLLEDVDYLTGKWADKEGLSQLYAMSVCLFYLALILEITGAAILATQVLSDREKKYRQDNILRQLGMNDRLITRLHNRELSLIFLLPVLPAMIISSCFIWISADKIHLSTFQLPVFTEPLWITRLTLLSFIIFFLFYSIYYIAARISYGRPYHHS